MRKFATFDKSLAEIGNFSVGPNFKTIFLGGNLVYTEPKRWMTSDLLEIVDTWNGSVVIVQGTDLKLFKLRLMTSYYYTTNKSAICHKL